MIVAYMHITNEPGTPGVGEMVFCDGTSTLDRFNTSLFVLSTSNACGGLQLGVIITSDEQEETVT